MVKDFRRVAFAILFLYSALGFSQAVVIPDLSKLRYLDANTILTSPEYTFQDQTMVDEPGRMTIRTDYKLNKAKLFVTGYLHDAKLSFDTSAVPNLQAFKAGYFMNFSPSEQWHVDSEPVCIEVNHSPRNIFGVAEVAPRIFKAAKDIALVPYINPGAERSGMGHIHIGGKTLAESPFYKNPQLLRNTMVYFHKHSSLLWGFGEAYDIGANSNIESLHLADREVKFAAAVQEFDQWFASAPQADKPQGLKKFLQAMRKHIGYDAFQHYRNINLEHLKNVADDYRPEREGKLTVEFRGFRPPKTAQHAVSDIALLLKVLDHLAQPNYLEPFEIVGKNYERFFSASKVAADWELVSKEVGLTDPILNDMVNEYVETVHRTEYEIQGIDGARLFAAFSEKNRKGLHFEILIPAKPSTDIHSLRINEQLVTMEKIKMNGLDFWTGVLMVDNPQNNIIEMIKLGQLKIHKNFVNKCLDLFAL